jgi:hypothetical protein
MPGTPMSAAATRMAGSRGIDGDFDDLDGSFGLLGRTPRMREQVPKTPMTARPAPAAPKPHLIAVIVEGRGQVAVEMVLCVFVLF